MTTNLAKKFKQNSVEGTQVTASHCGELTTFDPNHTEQRWEFLSEK